MDIQSLADVLDSCQFVSLMITEPSVSDTKPVLPTSAPRDIQQQRQEACVGMDGVLPCVARRRCLIDRVEVCGGRRGGGGRNGTESAKHA